MGKPKKLKAKQPASSSGRTPPSKKPGKKAKKKSKENEIAAYYDDMPDVTPSSDMDIDAVELASASALISASARQNSLFSYDATTHFESTVMDVLSMYRQITEKALLMLAAIHGKIECVEMLLGAGTNVRRPSLNSAMDNGALVCASVGEYGCPGSTQLTLGASIVFS